MTGLPVELGRRWCGVVVFWLRQGKRDRGVDQFEGPSLGRGRHSDLVEGGAADGDRVAGQGSHVLEQPTEAVQRLAVSVAVVAGFALGGGGSGGGGDGVV